MCYSARIIADYKKYVRMFGADISLRDFVKLVWEWNNTEALSKMPRALVLAFRDEPEIAALIAQHDAAQKTQLEQLYFEQRQRLIEAERKLQTKTTKAALESRRIAMSKTEWAMDKLAGLRRTEPAGDDWRIFPRWYAPVMVVDAGG